MGRAPVSTPLSALVDQLAEYESGEMSDDDTINLFQDLVNTGLAWQLQGSYGRQAAAMLEAGMISSPFQTVADSDDDNG